MKIFKSTICKSETRSAGKAFGRQLCSPPLVVPETLPPNLCWQTLHYMTAKIYLLGVPWLVPVSNISPFFKLSANGQGYRKNLLKTALNWVSLKINIPRLNNKTICKYQYPWNQLGRTLPYFFTFDNTLFLDISFSLFLNFLQVFYILIRF